MKIALLVANLFTRVPLEAAVRASGAQPVLVSHPQEAVERGCGALVVDLTAGVEVQQLASCEKNGTYVLAFAPRGKDELLAQVRRFGGVALPRGTFLRHVPELMKAVAKPVP